MDDFETIAADIIAVIVTTLLSLFAFVFGVFSSNSIALSILLLKIAGLFLAFYLTRKLVVKLFL
jgi:hypothetical protein